MAKTHHWTEEEYEWLRVNAPAIQRKDLLVKFNEHFNTNIKFGALGNAMHKSGAKTGINSGCFKKGREPFNKGKKWDEFMSPEGQANSRKTHFNSTRTVNNANHNHREVGDEWVDEDGYTYVRMATRNPKLSNRKFWKLKHHIVWEQHHGPVPEKHKIIFADGNRSNFDINNLILVSNAEEVIINKQGLYYKGHPELTKSGVMIAKVLNGINIKKKENKNG